jgi:endonuclease/exonuclease/phosphatase family metal-dependent hydrolase
LRRFTINVGNFNLVGVDATAQSNGVSNFDERLDRVAAAIADFDVVALQEISADQVERLAEKAGFEFHEAYPDLGLLSRWKLTDVQQLIGDRPGCVIACGNPSHIQAATVHPVGPPIRIVNTHMLACACDPWRAAQATQIRQTLVDTFPGRVIVTGDFNGNDDLAQPKGILRDAYNAMHRAVAPNPETGTVTDHCGDRIELILMSPAMAALTYDGIFGKCPKNLDLSDHPRVSALLAP